MNIPQAHLEIKLNRKITKNNTKSNAYPLNEIQFVKGIPEIQNCNERKLLITRAINYLDVENSLRYQPMEGKTYCNIYAYDLLKLLDVYIPRVWWLSDSIEKIKAGETLNAIYDETVEELNTNNIYDWLNSYSSNFEWEEAKNFDILCEKIKTNGTIGIICGKNLEGKGHIAMAYSQKKYFGLIENVYLTDAGMICKKKYNSHWWNNTKYKIGFYYFRTSKL